MALPTTIADNDPNHSAGHNAANAQINTNTTDIGTLLARVPSDPVLKALYDANTILAANTDDTPAALPVPASTLVGRGSTGNIASLTPTQVKTLLSLDDESLQDLIGAMVSGNTQSGITVTYNDATGKLDFTVSGGGGSSTDLSSYYYRSGSIRENIPRQVCGTSTNLNAGQPVTVAIALKAGDVINNMAFMKYSIGFTTSTHWWFALLGIDKKLVAATADQLTAPWAAQTAMSLPLTAPYTVPTTGLYYAVCAATGSSLGNLIASAGNTSILTEAPALAFYALPGITGAAPAVGTQFTVDSGLSQVIWTSLS